MHPSACAYLQDLQQAQYGGPDILHRGLYGGVSLRNLRQSWTHQRATGDLHRDNKDTGTIITSGLGGTVNHEQDDTYPLDDVQQATKVMRVTALSEVHQQLGGLFPDSWVAVFSDAAQLRDNHHFNQLILERDKGETQDLNLNLQTYKLHQENGRMEGQITSVLGGNKRDEDILLITTWQCVWRVCRPHRAVCWCWERKTGCEALWS